MKEEIVIYEQRDTEKEGMWFESEILWSQKKQMIQIKYRLHWHS